MTTPQIKTDHLLRKLAVSASLSVATILFLSKFAAWWVTGSLSIFSSWTDSSLDVITSLMNFLAVYYAIKPADTKHRFGHGRIEDIVGLLQSIVVGILALLIISRAIMDLISPRAITSDAFGIGIMTLSLVLTSLLVLFQKYVIIKTGSVIVKIDSLHYTSDILTNIAILLSLLSYRLFGIKFIDPLIALLIAIYILYSVLRIGRNSFDNLMDKEIFEERRRKIENTIISHQGIKGFHDLRTRMVGNKIFIQCHVEIDQTLSLSEAHNIVEVLEKKLVNLFPLAEVIIHADPHQG